MFDDDFMQKIINLAGDFSKMVTDELLEIYSERIHLIWSNWMLHLFDIGNINENGNLVLNGKDVKRWIDQIKTHYEDLSEKEKDIDREIVKKYLFLNKEEKDNENI